MSEVVSQLERVSGARGKHRFTHPQFRARAAAEVVLRELADGNRGAVEKRAGDRLPQVENR